MQAGSSEQRRCHYTTRGRAERAGQLRQTPGGPQHVGQSGVLRPSEARLHARHDAQRLAQRTRAQGERLLQRHRPGGLHRRVQELDAQDDHDHEVDGRVLLECALCAQNRRRRHTQHEAFQRVSRPSRVERNQQQERLPLHADHLRSTHTLRVQVAAELEGVRLRRVSQVLRRHRLHVQRRSGGASLQRVHVPQAGLPRGRVDGHARRRTPLTIRRHRPQVLVQQARDQRLHSKLHGQRALFHKHIQPRSFLSHLERSQTGAYFVILLVICYSFFFLLIFTFAINIINDLLI